MNFIQRYFNDLTKRSFIPGQGMVLNDSFMLSGFTDENQRDVGFYIQNSNTVYACNKVRSQLLSGLPLVLYKIDRAGKRTEITTGPLYELLQRVNPYWTFQRLIEMTEMSLGLWGEAYWFLDRGTGGIPQEIWWARSDRVTPVIDTRNYIKRFDYLPPGADDPIPFKPEEVIWLRYSNPLDEFEGMSPLRSAMIAADAGYAAAMSNKKLFSAGIQMAGVVAPAGGATSSFTEEQAQQIERSINRRFSDPKSSNKWAVLRSQIDFKPLSVTPKDAEFLGTLNWSMEEIARAYGVPLDLIGGQRTYENYNAAQRDIWQRTLIPEARFIANELTEQLLPLFNAQSQEVAFDLSEVDVLQEAANAKWSIAKEQLEAWALTINEWRGRIGLDPVAWGDVAWGTLQTAPILGPMAPAPSADSIWAKQDPPPAETPLADAPPQEEPRMITTGRTRSMEYGSPEHRAFMERADKRQEPATVRIGKVTADLMRRQRQSVLAKLRNRSAKRDEADFLDEPFNLPEWVRKFTTELRPVLRDVMGEAGQQSLDDLGVGISFDVFDPNVVRALEKQTQRFAREVNETTWNALTDSLTEGIQAGENVDKLADRVNAVMGDRIQSSGETIARTESNIAHSNADIMSWQQSGVVGGKEWLSALDDRTRESHVSAHGQVVPLDQPFTVGGYRMQAPGLDGPASEVVNCRCSMTAVLDIDMEG